MNFDIIVLIYGLVATIFMLTGLAFGFYGWVCNEAKQGMLGIALLIIGAFSLWGQDYFYNHPNTYYLEATQITCDIESNITVFSTPNGNYIVNSVHTEDVPYVLTMDNMRTTNTDDDTVLVVWKCDEGGIG